MPTLISPAMADNAAFYTGVSFANSQYKINSTANTKSSTGLKMFFGERKNNGFSGELQYTNFGFSSLDNKPDTMQAHSIGYAVLMTLPTQSRYQPFMKLGLHYWDADMQKTSTQKETNSGTDILFGTGMNIHLDNHWFIRAEFERFRMKHSDDSINTNLFSIGAVHFFR
jgi:hypothetical protein